VGVGFGIRIDQFMEELQAEVDLNHYEEGVLVLRARGELPPLPATNRQSRRGYLHSRFRGRTSRIRSHHR
jgi:hypothetical protein